ncbi:MAG: 3-keto-5-aminohexanoate cleavage protein [Pseudomonas sp.]|uniref:3-keto-5-aminohexanoate cleavage protein n=1 Tax=Pseudomonas sp. TaxID=306 RepID=UPI00339482EC
MTGFFLNLAPTGLVPTRAMSAQVPLSVDEIVADARQCIALGVNMLHLHVRDEHGRPSHDKDTYARVIGGIREFNDEVIIGVSLSGRQARHFEERAAPLGLTGDLRPDMASLTLSSLNFRQDASINSPEMVQRLAARMLETGIKPELEVFDAGMLNYARYLLDHGLLEGPCYFNLLLGNIASAQATPLALGALLADLPQGAYWCGGGIGSAQQSMNTLGLLFGHGARVGLEDYLWLDEGRTQPASNADLVKRLVAMAALLGKVPASPAQARQALGIKPIA